MDGILFQGLVMGVGAYVVVRCLLTGFFTVDQNERAVKTSFGRAKRLASPGSVDGPAGDSLDDEERQRYQYPQLEVIPPGGPYFKWPWERVHKVSVATQTVNMAFDPESPRANRNNTVLEAVTKDQLNVGLSGQLRFRVSERNLYAYLFAVHTPIAHVMGYFVSILRERIANFEAPRSEPLVPALADGLGDSPDLERSLVAAVSINDLRKNLRAINEHMATECKASAGRYGIELDASLITGIDPPDEVDSALAAINTAHNQVSSDLSLAEAEADQKIVESRRAVEIETLRALAEVEPLRAMAGQLADLKKQGPGALQTYLRNVRLALYGKARQVIIEVKR